MRETNDLYKRLLADPGHVKESRLIIGGEIYDESKIVLSSLVTTEQLFAADKLSIGGAVAREISFSAFLSDNVPKRAKIIHQVRLRLGDEVSEWLQKGEYYISTRRRNKLTGLTEVHGYDSMLTSEQPWKPADTDIFPMPMKEAVEKTAAILKIPLDSRNVYKTGDAYKVDYPVADGTASEDQQVAGLTIRQVWRWVAAAMGGNFIINDLGELRLVLVNDLTATGYLADENGSAITFGENAILVRTAAAAADSEDLSALGLNMAEASDALPLDPITRVILKISGDTGYVSESDTEGLTLEASCAYGSKTIADDLLAQLQGYVYQPLQAEDALIDPAAELGDPIEINGVYTILAQKTTTWDALSAADVGAPGEDELEDEYGFTSAPDSEYRYELAQARSLISKTNERISMEIYGEDGKGGLNGKMATYTMSLSNISTRVEDTEDNYSLISQDVNKIAQEVHGTDGNGGLAGKYAALSVSLDGIDGRVEGVEGEFAAFLLDTNGFYVMDASGNRAAIKGSSIDVSTLNVQQINFSGAISFADLTDTDDLLTDIDTAMGDADDALQAADDAKAGVEDLANGNYSGTFIDGTRVIAPQIYAGKFYATGEGRSREAAYYIYDSYTQKTDTLGNLVGFLSYDTGGLGTNEDAKNRVLLTTLDVVDEDGDVLETALKLQASGNMSLAAKKIYMMSGVQFSDVIILESDCYGSKLPSNPVSGQIYFKLIS